MACWAISGGSGFFGLRLARHLLSGRHAVRSLDLRPGEAEVAERGVEALVGDVRDPRAARWLCRGADVLVHAAAALPARRSEREIRSVAVDGTATLLEAATAAGVGRVVFLSSAVVYGLPRTLPLTEETPPLPFEAYGRAKLDAEAVCRAFESRGLETTVLRPTAFVGPERLGVFGLLFRWIREGRRIYTLGEGANRYQLLDVDDLVDAVQLSASRPAAAGQTYVLGSAAAGPVRDELRALIRHAGSRSAVTRVPVRLVRPLLRGLALARLSPLSEWHYRTADRDFVLDTSKAWAELAWTPGRTNLEALVRAYDWYSANGDGLLHGATHRLMWREQALGLVRRLS